MTIELESMAVEMPEVEGHPNRAAFRGVLTVVDAPSTRAPSGSGGKRVVLTRAAAEVGLASLIGMALDYAPAFDRHDMRRKVGVITSADVVGRNLEVGGYLYAKDFPEVVEEIAKTGGRTSGLGPRTFGLQASVRSEGERLRGSLAYAVERLRDLTGMRRVPGENCVASLRAEAAGGVDSGLGMSFEVTNATVADKRARVWTLLEVTFTGAAILRRDKAAFGETWIEMVG